MSAPAQLPSRASYTQIATYQRCRFKFWLKYVRGISPQGKGMGLLKGTLLHEAYDRYLFNGRRSHDDAYDHLHVIGQQEVDNGVEADQVERGIELATSILDKFLPWADENDKFEVYIPEGQQQCETSGELPIKLADGSIKKIFFKIDELITQNGSFGMLENKFRKNIDDSGLEHDLQILIYQAAWNVLNPDKKIEFVLYNIVADKAPKTGKNAGRIAVRQQFYRGEGEQRIGLANVAGVMYEMKRQAEDERQVWPLTPSKDCNWDCDLVGLCLGIRAGGKLQDFVGNGQFTERGSAPAENESGKREALEFSIID